MRAVLSTMVLIASAQLVLAEAPPTPPGPEPEPEPAAATEPGTPTPASDPGGATALAPTAPAAPMFAAWPTPRLALDLELYSQARWTNRTGDDLTELRLDRGELGARVALGAHGAAQLRLEAIRSAVDGGALGIDGDSLVVRLQHAQVAGMVDAGPLRLEGALGLVPDPWMQLLEDGYTQRPLSRVASQRLLGWPNADLAMLVRATLGRARLTVTVGNGEGVRYPERNAGKTTTGVLEVVAIAARSVRLSVAAMGKDGSLGVASIRDRRVGVAASLVARNLRVGLEGVRAWGIGDRGEAEGVVLAGWAEAHVGARVFLGVRGATLGLDRGGRQSTFGGAVAIEPWTDAARGRLRLWLALDRVTSSGDAMPLPGADAGDATIAMVIASATAPFFLD